jgi:riboflavin synthase
MFTGIVTAVGTIARIEDRQDRRFEIACPLDPQQIAIGASIACSGICLTVVERGGAPGDAYFRVDVSTETMAVTAAGAWQQGDRLNLERSLKIGDELGGHLVTGHVDAIGRVVAAEDVGGSTRIAISAPPPLAPLVAPKGSITLDGVSLTVNTIEDQPDGGVECTVNVIPHTAEVTTLGTLSIGDAVNLEADVLARYLRRMQALAA